MRRRIHVTGNAGAGKTTLAVRLGAALGVPVASLDSVVWGRGWSVTPARQRLEAELRLTEAREWIIEGVSRHVRDKSDVVIFLDVSRFQCLWRCMKRNWRYLFRSRPGLPEDCPEWKIVPRLIRIIWQFPSGPRANILVEASQGNGDKYRVIRHEREIDDLVSELRGG